VPTKVFDKELRIEEVTNVMFVVSLIGSFLLIKNTEHLCDSWRLLKLTKTYYEETVMAD